MLVAESQNSAEATHGSYAKHSRPNFVAGSTVQAQGPS